MRASRGARAWVRTLRAMTYVFVVGAILLFGHAFVRLLSDAPPAEQASSASDPVKTSTSRTSRARPASVSVIKRRSTRRG